MKNLVDKIKKKDKVSLAKGITLIESEKKSDLKYKIELLNYLKSVNNTIRIGVTGPPGIGKSTFINQIGYYFLKKKQRVAVIAVDPSSASSKGSILGDKMRMHLLNNNKNAFVRPSPSKNKNSAIDFETLCSINLCELAEFDVILIETVGSGQLEYNISKITDLLIYLDIANTGDELQARDVMLTSRVIPLENGFADLAVGEFTMIGLIKNPIDAAVPIALFIVYPTNFNIGTFIIAPPIPIKEDINPTMKPKTVL